MRYILLLCFFLLFFAPDAFATPPKEIIFFGDSLSDNGNLYRLDLHILPKSPPYFAGRFSNGPTWAEIVGLNYQTHYKTPFEIYAWGGATAIRHSPVDEPTVPITLRSEIERYLLDALFKSKSNTLYSIWIGGNDYLFDRKDDTDTMTTDVVDETVWGINELIKHHAHLFLIFNLPDPSRSPVAQTHVHYHDKLHAFSLAHNLKLKNAIDKLKAEHPEVTLIYIDINYFYDDLINDPTKYNELRHVHITDTRHACWQGGYHIKRTSATLDKTPFDNITEPSADLIEANRIALLASEGFHPCLDPDNHLFWDGIHPSAVAHQMIAARVLERLAEEGLR